MDFPIKGLFVQSVFSDRFMSQKRFAESYILKFDFIHLHCQIFPLNYKKFGKRPNRKSKHGVTDSISRIILLAIRNLRLHLLTHPTPEEEKEKEEVEHAYMYILCSFD